MLTFKYRTLALLTCCLITLVLLSKASFAGLHEYNSKELQSEHVIDLSLTYDKSSLIFDICQSGSLLNPNEIDTPLNGRGETRLILATHLHCNERVSEFLGIGASVDTADSLGNTALHHAVLANNLDGCNLLLASGVSVNRHNKRFLYSPLHLAVSHGHTALVEPLLKKQADFQQLTAENENALFLAVRYNQFESFKLLLTYIKRLSIEKRQPIFHQEAVLSKHSVITPLILASFYTNQSYFDSMVKTGVDLNQRTGSPQKPLIHLAIYNNQPIVIDRLLAAGANPDVIDADGLTPLMVATLGAQADIVESLLEAGASVDATMRKQAALEENQSEKNLITALFLAIQEDNLEIGRKLLASNATIDNDQFSCTTRALKLAHYDFFALLVGGFDTGIAGLTKHGEYQQVVFVSMHWTRKQLGYLFELSKEPLIFIFYIMTGSFITSIPIYHFMKRFQPLFSYPTY